MSKDNACKGQHPGAGIGSDSGRLAVLDLFCGAGGLSLGFKRAGFDVALAADHSLAAVKTYARNFDHPVLCADIAAQTDFPKVDVVVGGPPCQGFSSAGLRRSDDQRNSLVAVFARIIVNVRPRAFVFENVEGFLTADNGARLLELVRPLIGAGYRIHLRKINAANYGVPQLRKRVICMGGLGWDPTFPDPTHSAHGAPGAALGGTRSIPTPTVHDVIGDLPPASHCAPGSPIDHYSPPLTKDALERVCRLKPGQTMRDLPESLWQQSYRRRAYRRVMDGTPTERRGGAPAGLRRLRPDEPCKAITGAAKQEFIHPFENRALTLRECARIQTFPDNFEFYGNASDKALMIGNAVPPLLASILAESIGKGLRAGGTAWTDGCLLSFVPTLSAGMSPALQQITKRIKNELRPLAAQLDLSF